jgi:hypothetical protein
MRERFDGPLASSAPGLRMLTARVNSIVDATFSTPVNARPLVSRVDLVIHSATNTSAFTTTCSAAP